MGKRNRGGMGGSIFELKLLNLIFTRHVRMTEQSNQYSSTERKPASAECRLASGADLKAIIIIR